MPAAADREGVRLDDAEGGYIDATWSRSGKRLIVTVGRRDQLAQVELRPEQVEQLAGFLAQHP